MRCIDYLKDLDFVEFEVVISCESFFEVIA